MNSNLNQKKSAPVYILPLLLLIGILVISSVIYFQTRMGKNDNDVKKSDTSSISSTTNMTSDNNAATGTKFGTIKVNVTSDKTLATKVKFCVYNLDSKQEICNPDFTVLDFKDGAKQIAVEIKAGVGKNYVYGIEDGVLDIWKMAKDDVTNYPVVTVDKEGAVVDGTQANSGIATLTTYQTTLKPQFATPSNSNTSSGSAQ
jgi:hypothetical protein